ncbi:MAG: class I SAM-dependent methyltransferase [Deltaproteobacteria bacterium]|nr:class I SAM-dependent methyltransferase [Deltaproteobacteria bacterium]
MKEIHHHFSRIAYEYEDLRTTDIEPILLIKNKLVNLTKIKGADIGCGGGRYDIELFNHLGKGFHLICIDYSENMLRKLDNNLNEHNIKEFSTVRTSAMDLPLTANCFDVLFSFNAVHHFNLLDFLEESSRVLRNNGQLFIYTRLRSQNQRNIWGRFFPKFHEKEKSLLEINEFERTLKKASDLILESIEYFMYKRKANLEWLVKQAKKHHYSTFSLYSKKEFEESLKKFQLNIISHFKDPDKLIWNDENIMFNIKKGKATRG